MQHMYFRFVVMCFLGSTLLCAAQGTDGTTSVPTAHQSVVQSIMMTKVKRYAKVNDTGLLVDEELRPFYHGVASGDPLADRVIIWTRVTPEHDQAITVGWQVATDVELQHVVASGSVTTDAQRDYTVKVDVANLQPGTTYYYWFTALDKHSLVGRMRTAPQGPTAHSRFAVVSCNSYPHGFYNAFGRIADRNDLDAVLHLGDYIYEYEASPTSYGGATGIALERQSEPSHEIVSLADYRTRYAQYRLDANLRRAHQQQTFINIWDDHESANDSYKDGAENHQEDTEGSWTNRKSIAKQAFFEWLPIRDNPTQRIYRTFRYGDLAEVLMIDTRLEGRDKQVASATDPALNSEERTLLGQEQLSWFTQALSTAHNQARWKIIGNQIIFAHVFVDPLGDGAANLFLDVWNGYPAERQRVIGYLAQHNIDNTVFLAGDFHSSYAFEVAANPFDPTLYNPTTGEGALAVEFATPSITSANFDENLAPIIRGGILADPNVPAEVKENPAQLQALVQQQVGQQVAQLEAGLPAINPHLKYTDLDEHGYFVLDVTPSRVQADYYFVDDILKPTNGERFERGLFTNHNANHLEMAEQPSAPKAKQETPAPATPPQIGTTSVAPSQTTMPLVVLNCYPNPVRHLSYLTFALTESVSQCRIALFDLQGQKVADLVTGPHLLGVYTLTFDTSQLAPGAYYYHFSDGTQTFTRKIIVE